MTTTFGSKRVVVGAHYGLRDWIVQRVTAVLMAVYTLVVVLQMLAPGPLTYERWAGIFAPQWMRAFTFVIFVAIAWHAWVGVRDIWMDYVKPAGIRLLLQILTIVWLVGCLGWAVQVLWRF